MKKFIFLFLIYFLFSIILYIPVSADESSINEKVFTELETKIYSLEKLNSEEKIKLQEEVLKMIEKDKIKIKAVIKALEDFKNDNYDTTMNFIKNHYNVINKIYKEGREHFHNKQKEYTSKNIERNMKGNLVIKPGESVIIENRTTRINGDIVVKPGGSLRLINNEIKLNGNLIISRWANLILDRTELIIIHKYKGHREINFDKYTNIKINDSAIKTEGNPNEELPGEKWLHSHLDINLSKTRVIEVNESLIQGQIIIGKGDSNLTSKIKNSTVSMVRWNTHRKLIIDDYCKLGSLIMSFGGGKKETLIVKGIKSKKVIKNFNIETNDGGKLEINNVKLYKRFSPDFWVRDKGITRKKVIFKDCDMALIQTKFPPTDKTIKIFNLPSPGYIKKFDLSQHVKDIELPYNYIIQNCNIGGIKPELWGTDVHIEDSYLMFHCQGGNVNAVVKNSIILNHFNYGSKEIIFDNVKFIDSIKFLTCQAPRLEVGGEIMDEGGTFNHTFKSCEADLHFLVVAAKKGRISGDINFKEIAMNDVHWEVGEITREFPVKILNEDGRPYSNKVININDKKLRTDKNGEVNVEFTFSEDNYNKTRDLVVETNRGNKSLDINFIMDTPIEITI